MAQLDPSIILSGQPMNMLGILDASNRMAGEQNDRLHQQQYRNMLATNGAGIMSGDQNALNALAGYDPAAALGIQNTRQEMDFSKRKMGILDAQERREAEEYARGLTADQRAAEAKQIEDAVKMGLMIPDAATWDQTMATMAPELVGQFDNRQSLAYRFMEVSDALKQAFPEPAAPLSSAGKLKADLDAGRITPEQFAAEMSRGNMSFAVGPDGTVNFSQGAGGGAVKPLTEAQSKLTVFQTDMVQAAEVLNELEQSYDPTNMQDATAGILGDKWGSFLQSGEGQIYKSAALQWLDSGLRIRTGAAATEGEVQRQYVMMFPQPGDKPATVAYKRRARENFQRAVDAALTGVRDPMAPPAPNDMFTPSNAAPADDGSAVAPAEVPQITDKASFDALPSGAEFIAPDGSRRRKP